MIMPSAGVPPASSSVKLQRRGDDLRDLNVLSFLLNAPFSVSTVEPNNASMRKLSATMRKIDGQRGMDQWMKLYRFLAEQSLVYLLPSTEGLQDQVYVANLGIVLPHTKEPMVAISNYRSVPRRGESDPGATFFRSMGFKTELAPQFFEGEADLKHLRDNIYIGAHGLRTSMAALEWFQDRYDMRIIPVRTHDEHLYHLDCVLFPLNHGTVILCTAACSPEEVREIESVAAIIDVPLDVAHRGITNAVRCKDYFMCDSHLEQLRASDPLYEIEKTKVELLETICARFSLELRLFNLSEFYKSGAMLSCMVMHLNRIPCTTIFHEALNS